MWVLLALTAACDRAPCEVVAWADADGDGSGDPRAPVCRAADGVADDRDCDDGDPAVHPGAAEQCDGVDQDCDGWIDDHPEPPRWLDRDGDGFGSRPLPNCDAWGVDSGGDCDDADPFLNPDTVWYADGDGDGAGGAVVGTGCEPPAPGAVRAGDDCDDADPERSPLAHEDCAAGDRDCDPTNDSSGAWMVPDAAARRRLVVRGALDVPLLSASLPPGVDPATVRVVVQDCAAPLELPATFLPDEPDPRTSGAPAPGTLAALWDTDGDLATVEPWPAGAVSLGVYWGGGPPPAWGADLVASDVLLDAGPASFVVDPARGGLLSDVADLDGTLAGQAQATAGNGLRTPRGPLSVAQVDGDSVLTDVSPVTAGLATTAIAADPEGRFSYEARWRVFAGRAAALGRITMLALDATSIEGPDDRAEPIRPLQLRTPLAAACAADPALGWGDLSVGDRGLTWAWVAAPRWVNVAGCGDGETWTSANDLPAGDPGRGTTGTVPAGQAIVDGAVLALLPHGPGGPGGAADRRAAWVRGVVVTASPTEE